MHYGASRSAGNFSYFSPDEYTRSSLEVKGRLYPNEQALTGLLGRRRAWGGQLRDETS